MSTNVERRRPKDLVLIDARAFAEKLVTPAFVCDAVGDLVYYNEAAEAVLGRSFGESGEMPAAEWSALFSVRHLDGSPMSLDEMPGGVALLEGRPHQARMLITGLDGEERRISVTGLPIFSAPDRFAGAIIFFWDEADA